MSSGPPEETPPTDGGKISTNGGALREGADSVETQHDYEASYSEAGFWTKVGKFAVAAGVDVIRKALVLYHCLQDPATPKWAKAKILGALGYFIVPLDAIPDLVPVVGFADDLGVLALAFAVVLIHIKPAHKKAAAKKIQELFGDAAA